MAREVATVLADGGRLAVQAGTGTGKSLAYLVPAVLSGRRVVVATATRTLQDQLAQRDLPQLAAVLGDRFRWAVLKGRSNYLCRQRLDEQLGGQIPLELPGGDRVRRDIRMLAAWADVTPDGDRAGLETEPHPAAWAAVSVSAAECPGPQRCPAGEVCFAEAARRRAAAADVVVVNTHLYGIHLATGGAVLGDHDAVIIDEAHALEDILSATAGAEIGAGRFTAAARAVAAVLTDEDLTAAIAAAGDRWEALATSVAGPGGRVPAGRLGELVAGVAEPLARATGVLGELEVSEAAEAARIRAIGHVAALAGDLAAVASAGDDRVVWVDHDRASAVVRMAPVDVATAASGLAEVPAVILTSATMPPGLVDRLGIDGWREIDVGSPFDFTRQALLYCAMHLPDPRSPTFEEAAHAELTRLIDAAGGRTLALFTSWRAMEAAADAVAPRVRFPVHRQGELPRHRLLEVFESDTDSCLFATMSFWQGVDVPGPSLSLVVIDRIPFPRPDDPLLSARRQRWGREGFTRIDLPRAATLLAQGAGRLIRSASDRGVVAVLDRRLGTATYRWDLIRALPPMRRTRDPGEVHRFLAGTRTAGGTGPEGGAG